MYRGERMSNFVAQFRRGATPAAGTTAPRLKRALQQVIMPRLTAQEICNRELVALPRE